MSKDSDKTKAQLIDELAKLRQRVTELEAQPKGLPTGDVSQTLSEELDALLHNLPVGLAILGVPDFRYIRINSILAVINGLSAEEHLGKPLTEILPDAASSILPSLQKVVETNQPSAQREFSTRISGTTSEDRHFIDAFFPIAGDDGKPRAVGVMVIDITERKRAEDALHDANEQLEERVQSRTRELSSKVDEHQVSEQKFRAFVEVSPDAIIVSDPQGRILLVNSQMESVFGYAREEILGKSVEILLPDQFRRLHAEHREKYLVDPGTRPMGEGRELFGRKKDGREFPVEISLAPLQTADGPVILSNIRDVTARKLAEVSLGETNERLFSLLESTNAVPWEADAKTGTFTYVGAQAADLLGFSSEEWLEDDFWADHLHREDKGIAIASRNERSQLGKKFEITYRMIDSDGRVVWIQDIINVIAADGEPKLRRGFLIDITARVSTEQANTLLREELAHVTRVSTMGELAASIAHQLNQPLSAIVTNAQAGIRFLSADPQDIEEVRAALSDIALDGKRAGSIIHGLRRILQTGDAELSPLNINELIIEVNLLLRSQFNQREIDLNLDLASDLLQVQGARVELQQVFLNLIMNACEAIDYAESRSRELAIRTWNECADSIGVSVEDSGPGIAPDILDRIFDPFFTTKTEGLGMGLAINRTILEAHEAQISVKSNPSGGTIFELRFPAIPNESQ
jgi:PAS domain S-box-containing protein